MDVLTWDLHIIEFGMVEVDEVATTLIQWLITRSSVQTPLVAIAPVLEAADVLAELGCIAHEVLLDSSLPGQRRLGIEKEETHPHLAGQVGRELDQILLGGGAQLTCLACAVRSAAPLLNFSSALIAAANLLTAKASASRAAKKR